MPRLQSAPSAVPRAERGPIAGPRSAGMCSDWRTERGWRGWGGGNRLPSFPSTSGPSRRRSLPTRPISSRKARGRPCGGRVLPRGRCSAARCLLAVFARRRTGADELRYTFTAVHGRPVPWACPFLTTRVTRSPSLLLLRCTPIGQAVLTFIPSALQNGS